MRLRPSDMKTIYRRARLTVYDDEGNSEKKWGPATALSVNIQPASGRLNFELYGARLAYMKNIKYQGTALVENHDEGTGLCVDVGEDEDPDYVIVSINTFATHKNVLIERLKVGHDVSAV